MTSKSTKRIESKKKKMAALLEITKLNEHDRKVKKSQIFQMNDHAELEPTIWSEPRPKRPRTDKIENCEVTLDATDLGPSGKPKLSGDEYMQLKKMLREKTTKMRQLPVFRLRDVGTTASLTTDFENRVPLWFPEVQHLIMYSQLGHFAPYSPARWCALEKFNRLSTTCLFIIENISLHHFLNNETSLPYTSSTFQTKLEILRTNDYIKDLSMVPLTGTQMKKFLNEYNTLEAAVVKSTEVFDTVRNLFPIERVSEKEKKIVMTELPTTDRFPRTQLLLSGWQMVEENFPLPIKGLMERKYTGYVMTKDRYNDVTPKSKMFGIDCEMCKTTINDLELTRVSVVDEDLNTVYDALVKPVNRITDYLTKFSGITPRMMRNTTKRLPEVQEDLRRILPSDAILVGQSLSNDMHALKMMHPYAIDTSVIFNLTGDRLRKTKLKVLSQEFLKETIQDSRGGHCSTEDSSASLKLTQLKLKKSLYYGDAVMGDVHARVSTQPELGTFNYATSLLKQTTKTGKTALVVSSEDTCAQYRYYVDKGKETIKSDVNIKFASEKSPKDVVKKMSESMKQFSLNIGHITLPDGHAEDAKKLKNVDKLIKEIYENAPSNGLVIVLLAATDEGNGGCFIQLKKDL